MVVEVPAFLDRAPTGGPWIIRHGAEKLRAKYLDDEARFHSLHFDLYAHQRLAAPDWANRIEGADLFATLLMNSGVDKADVRAFMARAEAVGAALRAVPTSDLADATDEAVHDVLEPLFRECRLPGIGIAKVTKLLSMKRPRFIPMIDSQVLDALYGRASPGPSEAAAFGEWATAAVLRFRALLLHGENRASLKETAAQTTVAVSRELSRRGVDAPHPSFSEVRVLDNLLWFDWWGYEYFGFRFDKVRAVVEPIGAS